MMNVLPPAVPRPGRPIAEIRMLSGHRPTCGIVRREFLQVGFSAFAGMSASGLSALRSSAATRSGAPRAKSVILVFATGGMSHLDTFDLKPGAPEGIRGEFKPIDSSVPGLP